ncbi:GAF domain-containing protein [Anaerolinea sp.]|uniref:GAF domain-containing protein n=1 Tax=Anaerolinea sp. TaxID=1872519 RepID=UPI002ACD5E96|nr:adenylate/guanylate cyclase domain-containing protein [Anaerolinea sp.]
MISSLTTSTLVSLDAQLAALIALFNEVHSYLSVHRPAFIPDRVYQAVGEMAKELPELRKQVNALEGEWRNLRALAQVGQVVNSSLELDQVLQVVMDTIIRLTGAERGFLMMRNARSGELEVLIGRNWERENLSRSEFAVSRTIINRVVKEGQPIITTDAQEDPRFHTQDSVVAHNLRAILCVPLWVKQELVGVIYADNRVRSGVFTRRHLELLTGFANQAAVAIENARLFASVRQTLKQVTELKTLMDNVLASIPSGVITVDPDKRILLCNRAAAEILRQPISALVGTNLSAILPALDEHMNQVLRFGHTVMGLEMSPDLKEKGRVALRFNLSPLRNEQRILQGVAIVVEDLTEQRRLEAQQRLFERMVSPAIIEQIDTEEIKPGGQKREITTLFADIRGFTSYGEMVSPEELVQVLNRYLGLAAEIILAEGGTVDKFLGDAVMAWFNAPVPQPDHALRAVRAGLRLKEAVERLNREMPIAAKLSFGVGIHTGEAVLGLIGTEKRMDYTAIGDCVNTARRIQENASAGQVLISRSAYQRIADAVEVSGVFPIQAYGKREPVVVVEVLKLKS